MSILLIIYIIVGKVVQSPLSACCCIVRNSPPQSTNAKAFAEAYLNFRVFASAIKMPRQLNSKKLNKKVFLELKNKYFVKVKKISFIKKSFLQDTTYSCASIFIIHTFISYIHTFITLVR